jgi:DNA polymerase-3 subunit epsilon
VKKHDLVFIDIETTGLDAHVHEIIEVAVVRVEQRWADGEQPQFEKKFSWSVKIKPENLATADPVALRISGYIPSEWSTAISLKEALVLLIEKTDGAIMVAHNVAFDSHFLDTKLSDLGMKHTMHYHRLDTVSMAFAKLHNTPDASRYSLGELCNYFAITNENPHSALPDAEACYELFKKLIAM